MSRELERAKKKALRLLSYRPRTEFEIRLRLKREGFSEDIIHKSIDYLREFKYVDDRVFAREWVRYKFESKKKGKRYLYLELLQKGVSDAVVVEVLDSISDEEEYKMAIDQAKYKLQKGHSWPAVGRYLERQGFSSRLIYRAYNYLITDTTGEQP